MHREILGLVKGDGKIVDHRDRNTLNNQKYNLRAVNYSLNNYNTERIRKNNKSDFRGVCWCKRDRVGVPIFA